MKGDDECAPLFATYRACLKVCICENGCDADGIMQESLSKKGMDIDKLKLDPASFDSQTKTKAK